MTTQELIDLLKSTSGNLLSYDLDAYFGESPSDAQIVTLLNQAKNIISRHIYQFDPQITFTPVANQAVQDLTDTTTPVVLRRVLKVHEVIINGAPLLAPVKGGVSRKSGVWSYTDFVRRFPAWMADGAGTPGTAVEYSESKLLLYPKPSSSFSNSYIAGQYLAADLSASSLSAEPDLPDDLHIAIGYVAAVCAAEPTAANQEQLFRLKAYNEKYVKLMDEIRSVNKSKFVGSSLPLERTFV